MCVIVPFSIVVLLYPLQVKEVVAATEAFIARKITGHLLAFLRCLRRCCRSRGIVLIAGIAVLAIAGLLTVAAAAEFQLIQNDARHAALFLALFIFPYILIIATGQRNERTFLETHLANAIHQRCIEALDRQIDPAVIVFCTGIVDLLAHTEADEITLFRELDSG